MDLSGGAGVGGAAANAGPDLAQIETEQLSFQSASGEDKLRLLPSPWPADNLPPTTSSLLSVASNKGLIAAAGPDALVISSTGGVRQTFINEKADEGTKVKSFGPQATISIPRVSQVAFSSDESCLVIAAEQGGGLAVYDTNALVNGNTEVAFQLATEGESVRQILPNPNPAAELTGFFGIVTTNGKLLLADLKERKLVSSANGNAVFHENVSCACWSRLGKQIIAGLADGTAVQIDQQGAVKARIPEPPQLAGLKDPASSATPITSIFWLDTHDFLIIHTPINPLGAGAQDDSMYHLAHRNDKSSQSWTFSKFDDPCPPFGVERKPAHHFVQRLREWANLNDLLILSSTASTDIGLFTRSKTALDSSQPVTDTFTYTQPPDQSRAAMPMSADLSDTSPIGMALDLSVKEKIARPIPTDETLDESPVPLPALYVLNNEGMLRMWWIVYNESVGQSIPYPDLIAAGGPRPLAEQKPQPPASAAQQPSSSSPFSNSLSSTSNPPAQPSALGQSSFGTPNAPAFGGASSLPNRQSPWGAPSSVATGGSSFGKPSFGQGAFAQSGFGQVGGMGANKASVWGTPSQQQPPQQSPPAGTGSVFGGNASQASPFLSLGGNGASSGFAALGGGNQKENQSPFAKPSLATEPSGSTVSIGNNTSFGSGSTTFGVQSQPSMLGSTSPAGTFGKPSAPASREESMADDNDTSDTTSTIKPSQDEIKSPFGLGSAGFKLGSTFKGDGSAKDDLPKPSNPGAGLFGKRFGEALGETSKASSTSEGAAWWSGRSSPSDKSVKKEPGTEEQRKLSDIPPALPPKKEEEKEEPEPAVDDAPLPPDPTTWKPKPGALPPPVPPGFGEDFGKPKPKDAESAEEDLPEDAPLPPDFTKTEEDKDAGDDEGSPAGSPPLDLGKEKFSEGVASGSETAGPDDEGEEWSDEYEGGEEEQEDESDEQGSPEITDPNGLSAFQARLAPASPKRTEAKQDEKSMTPATDKKDSYTPAGLPKAPIMFPPPQKKGPESPRSPSPVRSATSPLRQMPTFGAQQQVPKSVVQHPLAQQSSSRAPSTSQSSAPSQAKPTSQTQPPQRIAVPPSQLGQSQQLPPAPPTPVEPEGGDLEDEEDTRVQAILAAPIEPMEDVPAFLAHQDYVASGEEKPGIGGQIERVYRDINSMIDTLALNARSMRGFVEGNLEPQEEEKKTRLDLEDESWLLGEAADLAGIIEGIEVQLEDGRLDDVRGALENLREEDRKVSQLRMKSAEARKTINAKRDPEQLAQQHNAALPLELQTLQSELRQEVQGVQKLLSKAEEQLSVLRAELASLPSAQNGEGRNGAGVPTVEAVEKTIKKMTQMIQQKSGDIDVLESQIKRLGGSTVLNVGGKLNENYEDDLAASLKASKLSHGSPAAMMKRSRVSLFGSPAASRRTPVTPGARKSLFDVSNEEVESYRAKKDARQKAMARLREMLVERGPRVVQAGGS